MYTKDKTQKILKSMKIAQIAEKLGIKTHKKGSNIIVDECPFCGEKSVMYISPEHDFFKCMRCGESGSKTRLIMLTKNVSREEAIDLIEQWSNE